MSKLGSEYYAKLKQSLKTALQPISISATCNRQLLAEKRTWPLTKYDVVSTNKAITLHCQTGEIQHARNLFDTMLERTVVSWNTMITGYSKRDMFPEALELISIMHRSDFRLNETTFATSLSVCGRARSLTDGKEIHCLVVKSGYERYKLVGSALLYVYANCYEIGDGRRVFDELHEENELLWSLILVGYVQCNLFNEALDVFDKMPKRGVVEWSTLISGYVKSDNGCKKALELFNTMWNSSEANPNEFTLDSIVRACGRLGDLRNGKVVHGLVVKIGFEFECSINKALILLYSRCEVMDDAKRIYNGITNPCLDDTNELLRGFVKLRKIEEAELIFSRMAEKNSDSYNLLIKGYTLCGQFENSERLYMQMPVKAIASLNTMIAVYARNGEIDKAVKLFEKTKEEGNNNAITWNSVISGYVLNDQPENALKLYRTMHRSSVDQDRSTFSVLFHACACLGSLQQGKLLHGNLTKTPFSSNIYVGTALIDMYSRCGSISDAKVAFRCVSSPNVASWTALLNGYALHGLVSDALFFFNFMLESGVRPNAATLTALLSACARSGLVDDGMRIFNIMKEKYDVTPTVEHLTCVVDLLGRSGFFREAEELIKETSIKPDKILLNTLLNASWFCMDMKFSERVAEKIFDLDHYQSSACVIMSNMYSGSGKWEEKVKVRDHLKNSGVKKNLGCSWVDVNNKYHVFSVDDRNHPEFKMICSISKSLTRNVHSDIQIEGG